MMPDVSGYDVLRELTLTEPTAELPVLVLTNFPEARNDEEKRLLEQGLVLDVLPKSAVHDNPPLLPHIIDWHLQVAEEPSDARRPRRRGRTAEARMKHILVVEDDAAQRDAVPQAAREARRLPRHRHRVAADADPGSGARAATSTS